MIKEKPTETQYIWFGAGGDISWRLVVPALFKLFLDGHLPKGSACWQWIVRLKTTLLSPTPRISKNRPRRWMNGMLASDGNRWLTPTLK